MFLRFEGDKSICRNSLYEFVCNSIRFGGAMGSLILPKLILSFNRDAMVTFSVDRRSRAGRFQFKQRKASPPSISRKENLPAVTKLIPRSAPRFKVCNNFK